MNKVIIKLMEKLGFPKKNIPICIETGTHRGWGTAEFVNFFEEVYTIELSQKLFEYCKETYDLKNAHFIQGHSPEILKKIVNEIDKPYFLFLDAHGSGGDTVFHEKCGRFGSPVLDELNACKRNPPVYIVIDDYDDFLKLSTYPNISDITNLISKFGDYTKSVINEYRGWLVYQKN